MSAESLLATPEWDEALLGFIRQAVEAQMSALDPLYGSIRRRLLPEGVGKIEVEVEQSSVASPFISASEVVAVEKIDVVEGNLEAFHDVIAQIADSYLPQLMRPFFEHLGTSAEAVGNAVSLDGAPLTWDVLLDQADKVEWGVDDLGHVQPPQVVAGPKGLGLDQMTEAQVARLNEIAQRKQEEHVSRRRSRRLR